MAVTVINRAWQLVINRATEDGSYSYQQSNRGWQLQLLTEQQRMAVTVINRATEDGSYSYQQSMAVSY